MSEIVFSVLLLQPKFLFSQSRLLRSPLIRTPTFIRRVMVSVDRTKLFSVGHGFEFFNFDFENLRDQYKVLDLNYNASDDEIRYSFIRLALKCHPDKFKEDESATSRFQEINEAYQVLSDPCTRQEYDKKRMRRINEQNTELLNQYKELILTCNGLGMKHYLW